MQCRVGGRNHNTLSVAVAADRGDRREGWTQIILCTRPCGAPSHQKEEGKERNYEKPRGQKDGNQRALLEHDRSETTPKPGFCLSLKEEIEK